MAAIPTSDPELSQMSKTQDQDKVCQKEILCRELARQGAHRDSLQKENDPAKAAKPLLACRCTPLTSTYSPVHMLMGRNIKSIAPTFKEKEEAGRENQKRNFDNRHKVQEMNPLSTVFITDMKKYKYLLVVTEKPSHKCLELIYTQLIL